MDIVGRYVLKRKWPKYFVKVLSHLFSKYGYPLSFHLAVKQGLVSPYLECVAKHRALGFGNNQLLISMHHNTPDNTLPIIWFDEDKSMWTPIFRRYNKNYTEI